MATSDGMQLFVGWAKERADEMEAILASLEGKSSELHAASRTEADRFIAGLRAKRDEFSKQSGIQVLATTDTVAGKMTQGVKGDLIVDSVSRPSRVIGVADGQGGISFQYAPEEADRVKSVSAEILSRAFAPQLAAS